MQSLFPAVHKPFGSLAGAAGSIHLPKLGAVASVPLTAVSPAEPGAAPSQSRECTASHRGSLDPSSTRPCRQPGASFAPCLCVCVFFKEILL